MTTMKFLSLAALALTFAACGNDDNEVILQQAEQLANDMITITATLEADEGAKTRALSLDGDNIASTWELTDEFAILYNDGTSDKKSIATVKEISGTTVTITFAVSASLGANTPCTIVYPASAANDENTGADVAKALATQDGSIDNCPEVRVGTATIDMTDHNLTSVTKLAAQNAIFKFTLQDLASNDKTVTEFKVSDVSDNVLTTVTPSPAAGTLYVALPVMSAGTYWFNANLGGEAYVAKATTSAATVAGTYYSTPMKMATVGDVIKSDGKFYAAGTAGAVAMICYVGNDAGTSIYSTSYRHGLALALQDSYDGNQTAWCYQYSETCLEFQYINKDFAMDDMEGFGNTDRLSFHPGGHSHDAARKAYVYEDDVAHPTSTSEWLLPSAGQWDKMITAAGGYEALRDGFTAVGGTNLKPERYWTSTEATCDKAWSIYFSNGRWYSHRKDYEYRVRAAVAF